MCRWKKLKIGHPAYKKTCTNKLYSLGLLITVLTYVFNHQQQQQKTTITSNHSHVTYFFLRLRLFDDGNKRVDLVQCHLFGGVRSLHQFHTFYMLQCLHISTVIIHSRVAAHSIFTARFTLVQSAVLPSHVVCLSVRLSVTLVNCDHIGWNSSKIISSLVSLGCSLFATPTWRVCSKGNTPKFGPKVTHPRWFERRRHSIANCGRMVTDSATVTMESLYETTVALF